MQPNATSILYHQIRVLNSMGVSHLNRQEYSAATQIFHQALSELLNRLHNPAATFSCINGISELKGPVSEMESRRGTAKPTHRHGSDRHCVAVLTSVELTPKNSSLFSTDVFVLFHRGLLLNDPQDDVCCDDAASFHAASIALTYNVGLAHHLSGIEKGDLTLLSRALDFYLLAYVSMVDKEGVENSMKSSLALGMLALANNIGHIHATFCNFSRTNLCSEEILLRLVQLQDSQPGPSRHISKDEYKIFLLNASFFREFLHACAPAA